MDVNTVSFLMAFSVGVAVEYMLQKNPNIYQKSIFIGKAIMIAAAISLLPPPLAKTAVIGFLITRAGDLTGGLLYAAVVRVAVWVEVKQWDIRQNQTEEQQENSTTISDGT